MKRFLGILLMLAVTAFTAACSSDSENSSLSADLQSDVNPQSVITSEKDETEPTQEGAELKTTKDDTEYEPKEETKMQLNIQIGDSLLTADLADNTSAQALLELLAEGPVTVEMNDYAGMEKVGSLPKSLPRNDEQIDTDAGDLILYQGSSFVIYYGTNSWSLTRLGRINNVSKQELRGILGDGSVTAVLSVSD